MKRWLRDRPISNKILAISLATSGIALSAALAAFFAVQFHLMRNTAREDLAALATVLAANSSGTLLFNDPQAASHLLAALAARPEIASAQIVANDGSRFAGYGRNQSDHLVEPSRPGWRQPLMIRIEQPIMDDREALGQLRLVANLGDRLGRYAVATGTMMLILLVLAMVLAYGLAVRLRPTLTEPLLSLAGTARRIAENKDYTLRARRFGADEIGDVADAFNRMIEEIHLREAALRAAQAALSDQVTTLQHEISEREKAEQQLAVTQSELLETSRRAGQADVASNVLHNVGNVLNSVRVSVALTTDKLRASKVASVGLTSELLRNHQGELGPFFTDHPRGRMLIEYLGLLGRGLESERDSMLQELHSLTENLEHIEQIVATQQSMARALGVREVLPMSQLIEQALKINEESLQRHQIQIDRDVSDVPAFAIDRHRVLQILVNLIGNAKDAVKVARPPGARQILIRLRSEGCRLRVQVVDNGIGISRENLTRIFQHGFSTRKDGHGFGLHSGVLNARQLGGELRAESEGEGRGACFTLELPIEISPGQPLPSLCLLEPATV